MSLIQKLKMKCTDTDTLVTRASPSITKMASEVTWKLEENRT